MKKKIDPVAFRINFVFHVTGSKVIAGSDPKIAAQKLAKYLSKIHKKFFDNKLRVYSTEGMGIVVWPDKQIIHSPSIIRRIKLNDKS